MKPYFFFDMDGVLAQFDPAASEEETHMKGFFISRNLEIGVASLIWMIINAGFNACLLTSVYEDDHSRQEKRSFADEAGLADVEIIFVPYGEDKHKYIDHIMIGYEQEFLPVLIDDYGKNLASWRAYGYLPVKFFNGINSQPKLVVNDGVVAVKTDSWDGYSIDHRMSVDQMFTVLTAVSQAEAAKRTA